MEQQGISIETLQTRTDEFLGWVEEKQKAKGFAGMEIENLQNILEESLKLESFSEVIEFVRNEIRKWTRTYWNPTKLLSIKGYKNKTDRAEVLDQFPMILTAFLGALDRVEAYILEAEQEATFEKIKIRMRESIETLHLYGKETEIDLKKIEEKREKRRRSRSKQKNRARRRHF